MEYEAFCLDYYYKQTFFGSTPFVKTKFDVPLYCVSGQQTKTELLFVSVKDYDLPIPVRCSSQQSQPSYFQALMPVTVYSYVVHRCKAKCKVAKAGTQKRDCSNSRVFLRRTTQVLLFHWRNRSFLIIGTANICNAKSNCLHRNQQTKL